MSTENKIFKMSLDVSNLISNYKKAIQTMQDFGGPVKAITGFEQKLSRLEAEFANLQKIGAQGISKDPVAVNAYTKAVEKAQRNLSLLGDEMAKLGKNSNSFANINAVKTLQKEIDQLTKEAKEFQNAFSRGLQNAGVNRITADTMAREVKTEQQLLDQLRQELTLREKNLQAARTIQAQEEMQARKRISENVKTLINTSSTSALGITSAARKDIENSVQQGYITDGSVNNFIQNLNRDISQMLRAGETFQSMWSEITNRFATAAPNLNLNNVFGDVNGVRLKLSAARQEIVDLTDATKNRFAGATFAATNSVNQITNTINQVIEGSSNLTSLLSNVVQKENEVANATSRMSEAEQRDFAAKQQVEKETQRLASAVDAQRQSQNKANQAMRESAAQVKKTESAISRFAHMVGSMFSLYTIFASIRSEIRKTYEDIKTLDKSFASIAMVTDKSVSDMWSTYEQYADMASKLGQKTNGVIEASALFFQQGLDTNEALSLTTDTMKLATLAGEDYKTATQEMTAAIRGFKMEMEEGAHVTDVYSTLAAKAAASVNGIASAMQRTSSIASSAGASFENTAAFLTKMIG